MLGTVVREKKKQWLYKYSSNRGIADTQLGQRFGNKKERNGISARAGYRVK